MNTINIQEDQYSFPYHYIPTWNGVEFSIVRKMNWADIYLSYLFFVMDRVRECKFDSLLDMGCGDGRFLHEIAKEVKGKRLIGIDYFEPAIDFARLLTPDVEWVCGDIGEKNLFDQFDIVTMLDVLEHVHPNHIPHVLKGIHHYLLNKGRFFITVPSNNTPIQKKHYQHFDPFSLEKTLSPYFTIEKIYYLNRRPSKLQKQIKRLLTNRYYIVNHSKFLGVMYQYYRKHLLIADKDNCWRIAAICRKKGS